MIKLPLVGPAYKMQSQSISCQNCINWYPQTIEYPNGSRVAALMPTPGLKKIFTSDLTVTRCLYVLSNGALLAVIGKKLYHSKATKFELIEVGLISALGTVRIADNGQVAIIVNGTYTYALDLKTLELTRLSGSTIPRSTHVLFLDGRFVVNKANTGQFYWSDLYSTQVNALSYATAESSPDDITAIITFNRELWLFGAQSVERYYGSGSSNAPFARLSGGAMAFGCLAPDSIVSLSTGVIWLGVSEFGGNQIVMSAGGIPERISTHALEEEISSFTKTSDASAYAYQMEGHVFYVISFPSANVTYCFDVSTGLWHQRSFANEQGLHERHRSQHHAYFNNMHIVGDYRNGKLYQLDNNTFTDDSELILRERTAQAVITDKKLARFNKLEIVCETGFGIEKPQSIEPEQPLNIICNDEFNDVFVALASKQSITPPENLRSLNTNVYQYFELVIDGASFEFGADLPLNIEVAPTLPPPFPPLMGFNWIDAFRFTNLDKTSTTKIEFISKNTELFIQAWGNSTLVHNQAKTHYGACLATNKEIDPNPEFDGLDWAILSGISTQNLYINDQVIVSSFSWESTSEYLNRVRLSLNNFDISLMMIGQVSETATVYLRNEGAHAVKISFRSNDYTQGSIVVSEENLNDSFVEEIDGVTIKLGKQFNEDLIYQSALSNNFFAYKYFSVDDFSTAKSMMQIYINDELFQSNQTKPFYYKDDLEQWHGIRVMSKEFYDDPLLADINTYIFENMTESEIKVRFRYLTPLGRQSTQTALNESSVYAERNLCIVLAPRNLVVDVKDSSELSVNLRYEFSKKYPPYLINDLNVVFNILSDLVPNPELNTYFSDSYPLKTCNAICSLSSEYAGLDQVKVSGIFVGITPNKLLRSDSEGGGYETRWKQDVLVNNQWIRDKWGTNVHIFLNVLSEVYGLGGAGGNIQNRATNVISLNGQNGFAPITNFDSGVTVNLNVKPTGKVCAGGGGGASFPTGKLLIEYRERVLQSGDVWSAWSEWALDKTTEEYPLYGGTGGLPNGIVGNYDSSYNDFPYQTAISNEFAFYDYAESKMQSPRYAYTFNPEDVEKYNSGLAGSFAKRSVKSPADDMDANPYVVNNVIERSGSYEREFRRAWVDIRNDNALGGLAGKLISGGQIGRIVVEGNGKAISDDVADLDIEYI